MNKLMFLLVAFFLISVNFIKAEITPKREFRGAWIATVDRIDWPSSDSPEQQKQQLIDLLDMLQAAGINTVMFQVRPECDALYNSPYEPWSKHLTGTQGLAPNPYYDPLQFAIEEAHKRGMELHAWFNPYRAEKSVGSYPLASNHIAVKHPEWTIVVGPNASGVRLRILDPGLPMVRNYVSMIIADVVKRYDVDGVHMDDYFYPYPEYGFNDSHDQNTFNLYNRGFTNRGDWRRDNVNLLLRQIRDSVKAIKSHVKFGMSPFGIWKNGVPSGIVGMDAYNVIYCDAIAWLQGGYIDYLIPQLYWPIGGSQDFKKLSNWWADSTFKNNRHFYAGHGAYRLSTWSASEIPNQIIHLRQNPKTYGSCFFSSKSITIQNLKGIMDTLKNNYYKHKSLAPVMNWSDTNKPNIPINLRFTKYSAKGIAELQWDYQANSTPQLFFAIYYFDTPSPNMSDFTNPANIFYITSLKSFDLSKINFPNKKYIAVSAISRNWVESEPSNIIQINAPSIPNLITPINNSNNQRDTVILKWNYANNASSYILQVSTTSDFSSNFIVNSTTNDTIYALTNISGKTKYFWRVKAKNFVSESSFSNAYAFETGFPISPTLAEPPHATQGLPLEVTVKWLKTPDALKYGIQVSKSLTFNSSTIIYSKYDITDTFHILTNLTPNTTYFWRICAINQYGQSQFSQPWGFKTQLTSVEQESSEVPTYFKLEQNFPNPFNPSTTVKFSLPKETRVKISLYDAIGKLVALIFDDTLPAGIYRTIINFDKIYPSPSSGAYFYVFETPEYRETKKMLFIK